MSVKDVLLEIISSEKKDLQTVADFCVQVSNFKKSHKLETILNPFETINQAIPKIFKDKIDLSLSESQLAQIILGYLTNKNEFFAITKQRWEITSNYDKACKFFIKAYRKEKDNTKFTKLDRNMSASFQRLARYNILGKELETQAMAAKCTDKTITELAKLLIEIGSLVSTYANKLLAKNSQNKNFFKFITLPYLTLKSSALKYIESINQNLTKIEDDITTEKGKTQSLSTKIKRMSILAHEKGMLIQEKELLEDISKASPNSHTSDETSESTINNNRITETREKLKIECKEIKKELKEKLEEAKELLNKKSSPVILSPSSSPKLVISLVNAFENIAAKQKEEQENLLSIKKTKAQTTPITRPTLRPQPVFTDQQTSPSISVHSSIPIITPSSPQLSSPPSSPSNPSKSAKSQSFSRFFKTRSPNASPDIPQKKDSNSSTKLKDTSCNRSKTNEIRIQRIDEGTQSSAQSPNLNPSKHY